MRTSGVRFRDAHSIPGNAVLAFIDEGVPLSDAERAIVARFDGLRSIDELTSASIDGDAVRALISELIWYRSVVIEDVMTVNELDMFEVIDDDPMPFALRRRRRNSDSMIGRALVAFRAGGR